MTDSESHCQLGRFIDESQWDELLRQTRYSGLDISLPDLKNKVLNECSLMISTAVEDEQSSTLSSIEVM